MKVHRNENLNNFSFMYQWGYTGIMEKKFKNKHIFSLHYMKAHTRFISSSFIIKLHWKLFLDHHIKVHQGISTKIEKKVWDFG